MTKEEDVVVHGRGQGLGDHDVLGPGHGGQDPSQGGLDLGQGKYSRQLSIFKGTCLNDLK